MNDPLLVPVHPGPLSPATALKVPGSKSIGNRALVLAALADGRSILRNLFLADDTRRMVGALTSLGFKISMDEEAGQAEVQGLGGRLPEVGSREVHVGLSGNNARFLPPLAALGRGSYHFTAEGRMSGRPMAELFKALTGLGAVIRGDAFPFDLEAHGLAGGEVEVDISASSQFASGLLMAGPYMKEPLTLKLAGDRREIPYVAMTAELMRHFGVEVVSHGQVFHVPVGKYRAREESIEPDLSGACYFFAAAALVGGSVTVAGLTASSLQGDIKFLGVLKHMGCQFFEDEGGLTLQRDPTLPLKGVDVDMGSFSDQALTLAALAPFCDSPVTIRNIGHVRGQESDRLQAMRHNLAALGAKSELLPGGDGLTIQPARSSGPLKGGVMQTYKDHRVAMAFALPGLKLPGVLIQDPGCVSKTFGSYWDVWAEMTR